MSEHKFRCGDTARIEGADFDIEVAYADEQGYASWCGWPNGIVETKKLALVKACSDDEHRAAVARWLDTHARDADDARDGRRDRIERLYRPRAYWRRSVASARQEARAYLAHVAHCETQYENALCGPEDIEPLTVARAQDGGPKA